MRGGEGKDMKPGSVKRKVLEKIKNKGHLCWGEIRKEGMKKKKGHRMKRAEGFLKMHK